MEISFVIVNYKSENLLKNCVLSLENKLSSIDYEIIVINNDKDADLTLLETSHANLKVLQNDNCGFGKASNIGASNATGKFLFFLNPDTEILSNNIKELLKFANNQDIGIVGPRILNSKGKLQDWSCGYSINLSSVIKNNIGSIASKSLWSSEEIVEPDWISGCAMFVSKKNFDKLGGFDENFFMYFEDVDLCKRMKEKGLKIFYFPFFEILHFGGASHSDQKKQKKTYYKSQDYFFKKHFGFFQLFLLKVIRILVNAIKH